MKLMTLDDLEASKGNNSLCYIMRLLSELITKIRMKIDPYRPILLRRKCSAETVVCEDIRVMPIFQGGSQGASNQKGVENCHFSLLRSV